MRAGRWILPGALACGDATVAQDELVAIEGPLVLPLYIGATHQLTLVQVGNWGRRQVIRGTWRTSDAAVAFVDSNGVVHAQRQGVAVITGAVGPREARVRVETAPHGFRLRLDGDGTQVVLGADVDIIGEFLDLSGRVVSAHDHLIWSASNVSRIDVVVRGDVQVARIRPMVAGEVDVRAVSDEGLSGRVVLTARTP